MSKMRHQPIATRVFFLTVTLIGISACTAAGPNINQETACSVTSVRPQDNNQICKDGQKVSYAPERWGNEQLPIIFAALNCDHRFQIVHNKSAVSCIFKQVTGVEDVSDKNSLE